MKTERGLLILAMILPTIGALGYFVLFSETAWAKILYVGAKFLMIVLGIWGWRTSNVHMRDVFVPRRRELIIGVLWGVMLAGAVAISAWILWDNLLPAKGIITAKANSLIPLAWYGGAAVIFSITHAFFEEWYWRGYVAYALGKWLRPSLAITFSAVAFTGHHVIVLSQMFSPLVATLGSLGVLTAGVIWAAQTRKKSSLVVPWLSHICVDLAIFFVGFLLMSAEG